MTSARRKKTEERSKQKRGRLYHLLSTFSNEEKECTMIESYLKTAFRNMSRQKLYAAINLFGFAITMMVCIFIFLFVKNEFSYDSFFKNHDRIYRVLGAIHGQKIGRVVVPWSEAAKETPQIRSYTQIWENKGIIRRNQTGFYETVSFVDSTFFDVFPFRMMYGNPKYVLDDPKSAVLSQSTAAKLFGNEDPIGHSISIKLDNGFENFSVSGVASHVPDNSSIRFRVLIPYSNMRNEFVGSMLLSHRSCGPSSLGPSSFVKLESSIDKDEVQNTLHELAQGYLPPSFAKEVKFLLQPITAINLSSDVAFNMQSASNPEYSYILIGLGILILMLSSINFVNLTIARASHRFKEIGVRKVLGSSRHKLVIQFISDAMMFSLISLVIALTLTELMLPAFNGITGKHLGFNVYGDWVSLLGAVAIALFIGLVSGLYPAVYLSKFRAANVLKGGQKLSGRRLSTRFVTGFQFVVSAGLAICAIIMMEQMNLLQTKNLGFDKENVVVVSDPSLLLANGEKGASSSASMKIFMDQISDFSGIKGVTCSSDMPGNYDRILSTVAHGTDTAWVNTSIVGSGYLKTLGIELDKGRDFSARIPSDTTNNIIVNKMLVSELRLKHPLGKIITSRDPFIRGGKGRIIGVVKDFNFEPLNRKISPAALIFNPSTGRNYVIIRLRAGNEMATMSFLKNKWNKVMPGMPFTYHFLDDYLNSLYPDAVRWSKIIDYSALFALLLAVMGLFGLTSYMIEKRTKELGIRKILGATASEIGGLIFKEFLSIVIISAGLACPVSWYFMHRWLYDFAYRVDITVWPFLAASLTILLLTTVVTVIHVVKAATANPVESLRYE